MAHFAKIDENNVVVNLIVISNENENNGQEYINNELNMEGTWLKCSYNTMNGSHKLGGTPFRGNFPGVGWIYNETLDAFIPPKPEANPSFVLDEELFIWTQPVDPPGDGVQLEKWYWDEETISWKENF